MTHNNVRITHRADLLPLDSFDEALADEVMPKKPEDPNAWVRTIVDRWIDGDVGTHDAMTEIVEGLPPEDLS